MSDGFLVFSVSKKNLPLTLGFPSHPLLTGVRPQAGDELIPANFSDIKTAAAK
jgi:hypothetical protein